jgi:hypothetical protein
VNADVDVLPFEIDRLMGGGDLHVDMPVQGVEARETGHEPADREGGRQLDAQGGLDRLLPQEPRLRLDLIEGSAQHSRIGRPFGRRLDAAALPVAQRDAEPALELVQVPADRALSHRKLLPGAGQAAVADRGLEGPESIERREPAHRLP